MYKSTARTRLSWSLSLLVACATVAFGCDDRSLGDTGDDAGTKTTGGANPEEGLPGAGGRKAGAGGAAGPFGSTGGASGQAGAPGAGGAPAGAGGAAGPFGSA